MQWVGKMPPRPGGGLPLCIWEGMHKAFQSPLTEGCQSGKEGKQRPLFPCGFTHFEVAEE